MQEKNGTKKPRGRPATGRGTQIQVRLHDDLLSPLDKVQAEFDLASRPDAVRFVLKEWLQSQGRLPLNPPTEPN